MDNLKLKPIYNQRHKGGPIGGNSAGIESRSATGNEIGTEALHRVAYSNWGRHRENRSKYALISGARQNKKICQILIII